MFGRPLSGYCSVGRGKEVVGDIERVTALRFDPTFKTNPVLPFL
jgi:hypothetical protein